MKQADYWKNRFTQLEASQNQKGLEYYATLEREFEKAAQKADKELAAWYSRYATNENISYAEAKQVLTKGELSSFKMSVDDYIKKGKTLPYSDQWAKELERASAKFHVTRLEALQLQMQQQIEVMYGYELDTFDQFISNQYKAGYYKTMFEFQKGFGVGFDVMKLDDNKIAKLIAKPWAPDGQNFSSRIWRDKNKLMAEMPSILTQATIRGESYSQTAKAIMDRFNVSKSQAKNLVITESAFFSSASQTDCFNNLNVKQYEIIATLDGKTSDVCRMMGGKVFDMKDRKSGITCAPFHGRCRSTSAPYFNDEFELNTKRAARDPDTGKTYHVPADMKYPDWEKSFVNGGSKDGLEVLKGGITQIIDIPKQIVQLDVSNFPNYFTDKKGIGNTEAFVDYINNIEDADPGTLELLNSLGKLENIESNGTIAKVSYTAKNHAVRTSYKINGDIIEMSVKIPKLGAGEMAGSIQTTAHELGHMMDLFARKDVNKYGYLSETKADFFNKTDMALSNKVKDLFIEYNKKIVDIEKTIESKYKILVNELRDSYSEVLKNPYKYTKEHKEYKKQKNALITKESEESDFEIRNMMNGVNGLQDIYDALSGGSFKQSGIVKYGHGPEYYKSIDNRISEVWANYTALSVTRPDLLEILKEDKPELIKLMDEMKEEILKKVGV